MVKSRPLVDILIVLLGISSWVCLNGIWVELPIIVPQLPESWNLPSYLALIVQIANVGPLTYMVVHRFFDSQNVEKFGVFLILAAGCAATILLIWVWDHTTVIGGYNHSVSFMILVFIMALLECTSSVAFPAYVGNLEAVFLPSLLVGESLSGLLPSILSLVQGTGGSSECTNVTRTDLAGLNIYIKKEMSYPKPAITVEAFFAVLAGTEVLSIIAFIILYFLPESVTHPEVESSTISTTNPEDRVGIKPSQIAQDVMLQTDSDASGEFSWGKKVLPLLFLQAWICFLVNGCLPSIQTYSCMPYGTTTYHLVVNLQAIAAVLASSVALFFGPGRKRWKSNSIYVVLPLIVIGTICTSYIVVTAVMSPDPPLKDDNGGRALLVICWVIQGASYSYTKTHLASMLRQLGKKPLLWWGVSTQVGSLVGAVTAFLLVIVFQVLSSAETC